jgi:hypothetical protein
VAAIEACCSSSQTWCFSPFSRSPASGFLDAAGLVDPRAAFPRKRCGLVGRDTAVPRLPSPAASAISFTSRYWLCRYFLLRLRSVAPNSFHEFHLLLSQFLLRLAGAVERFPRSPQLPQSHSLRGAKVEHSHRIDSERDTSRAKRISKVLDSKYLAGRIARDKF